jgi:RNA polymerase sigma-70 factor (ECF subfamily)
MNEREWVQKILDGDETAREKMYRDFRDRLYATAVHFLGYQDPDAEDLAQQTFLIAFQKLSEFRFESSLYTWLNHICVNLCFERIRQRKKLCLTEDHVFEGLTLQHGRAQAGQSLEETITQARLEWLRHAIHGLKRRCREVVELRDVQGLDFAAIAKKLKVPLGTVLSRLARCRSALKRMAEKS